MTYTSCLDILIHKVQGKAQRVVFLILLWLRYTSKFENRWSMCLKVAYHCKGLEFGNFGLSSMHRTTFVRSDCNFKRKMH